MRKQPTAGAQRYHVSLVALPDAAVSTLLGIFDVMTSFALLGPSRTPAPFEVDIVGEQTGPMTLASGITIDVKRAIADITTTDIVIVPSIVLSPGGWKTGRYERLLPWMREMHRRGAMLCSACSGIFLLGETKLFDGKDVTVHFGYADQLAKTHPSLAIHPSRVLVISGPRDELLTSGASSSWHDLVLYLIARHVGATSAQDIARQFALQWHQDGLTPYMVFKGRIDHGDAVIEDAQQWLSKHFSTANPVDEMVKRSKLAERTFKRRFTTATGLAPIAYVQRVRVEDAKRRLERTEASIDEISWKVGYEDPAFFRRLFRRTTGLAPGAYRKRFRIPEFARTGAPPVHRR